jgi:multiple sugar transport system substrate-binding protein
LVTRFYFFARRVKGTSLAKEIVLSTVPIIAEQTMQQLLQEFESETRIHVNVQWMTWNSYRQGATNIALHLLPHDVLITGTTVTSDLISMSALRLFTKPEIGQLGGEEAFLPSRWRSGMRPENAEVWAIPCFVDLRMIHYNRALLKNAGLDEAIAFSSPQEIENTIKRLHEYGLAYPWNLVADRFGALHRASSWIWAYGGDLFSADGKRAIFYEKKALEGIRALMRLVPFAQTADSDEKRQEKLRAGQLGLMIENPYLIYNEPQTEIGCTAVPGGSYVGGSDVVIWKHTRNEDAALKLVYFLSRPDVTERYFLKGTHYVPVRIQQLQAMAQNPDPVAKSILNATLTGRALPCVPMVGLIEDRLGSALSSMIHDIMANPKVDVEALIQERIVTMGKRMNISLGNIP